MQLLLITCDHSICACSTDIYYCNTDQISLHSFSIILLGWVDPRSDFHTHFVINNGCTLCLNYFLLYTNLFLSCEVAFYIHFNLLFPRMFTYKVFISFLRTANMPFHSTDIQSANCIQIFEAPSFFFAIDQISTKSSFPLNSATSLAQVPFKFTTSTFPGAH